MAFNNHTDALARFITRDIEQYPFTYRKGCLRFLKSMLLGKGTICFVAEIEPSDYANPDSSSNSPTKKGGDVVAWAIWTRMGTSPKAREWQRKCNGGYWDMLNRGLSAVETKYHKTFPFTLSEHTFDHAHFNSIASILFKPWDPSVFAEAWELNGLYTHHEWQRRGIGSKLMEWGKERAREEGVPLIVAGSPVGGIAYRKAGFRDVDVCGFQGHFDELAFGGEEMRRWCWEPEGREGEWVERVRENGGKKREEEKEKWKGKGKN